MKRQSGYVLQTIGGDVYAVAVTPTAGELGSMVKLNPTGAFLFEFLKDEHNEEECIAAMLEKYDLGEEQARCEIPAFLAALKEAGLLV